MDTVTSTSPHTGVSMEFQPFYSFKHSFERQKQTRVLARGAAAVGAQGRSGHRSLSVARRSGFPAEPAANRCAHRPRHVHEPRSARHVAVRRPGRRLRRWKAPRRCSGCAVSPSRHGPLRPPLGHRAQWRLISHLSLNYLSPVEWGGERKPEVLREILALYDFADSPVIQQQIAGLTSVSSKQVMRRIRSPYGSGFARGIEATLEFDETRYVGSGVYLFAAILERFLGLYVSINSFSELVATTTQRGVFKRWPPRSGQQTLL